MGTPAPDVLQIQQHMQVLGSDGNHVGTVDRVEGDRIRLTRTDPDAWGEHRYIRLSAVSQVTDRVILEESAEDAKRNWQHD